MRKILLIFFIPFFLIASISPAEAIKRYWYNENGEREYVEITQEEIHRIKSAPRRAFIRQPRVNWDITPAMRARKQTTSQFTHRNYESQEKAVY